MPIGKDSITKRVAKNVTEENTAPELVGTVAAAPAKKSSAKNTSARSSSNSDKTVSQKKAAPSVKQSVMTNVDVKTVEKVVEHKETASSEKVSIGDDMPTYLL